ncbi:hypothetical protein [Hyunsoonleella ulvae]|uniref:hypothetical protein n=1 Tax=Hyunsoonleella ulvae TaxID=2799948 RepID=UPI00193A2C43|nr:hypothetical protein [Hyunsoonleella ulvae]
MRKIVPLIVICCFVLVSCVTDDAPDIVGDNEIVLADFISNKAFIEDEVIACAASDNVIPETVNVYFYPEEGATDFKLYESFADDGQDFSSYQIAPVNSQPLFGGALRFFQAHSNCKWFVVVFKKENQIEISTPIRSKVTERPTVWSENTITINQEASLMPKFYWDVNSVAENAIFFQVMATKDLSFISGTYTTENNFQYYKLNNVVLNITQGVPPPLVKDETYVLTIMDVSLDNWVNEVIMAPFIAE